MVGVRVAVGAVDVAVGVGVGVKTLVVVMVTVGVAVWEGAVVTVGPAVAVAEGVKVAGSVGADIVTVALGIKKGVGNSATSSPEEGGKGLKGTLGLTINASAATSTSPVAASMTNVMKLYTLF